MTSRRFLLGCFTLVACAQVPKGALEDKLPTLTAEGCSGSLVGLKALGWQELTAPGVKARGEFSKAVPEPMPKALDAALSDRRQDFEQLHRSLTCGAVFSRNGENALRKLAQETQRITESNFQPVGEKAFTPLIALTTAANGQVMWALLYLVFADRSDFRSSPGFSAELTPDGRLFVRTIGREIDRAHLSNAVAAGIVGFGLRCGPLSERHLPPERK